VTTVLTSISSSKDHPSPTTTTWPTPASVSDKQSIAKKRSLSIGVGIGIGLAFILLVSLLIYCIILQRKRKRQLAQAAILKETTSDGTPRPEQFAKPELDTWQEIHIMGNRDEPLCVYGGLAKAELQGRGTERFEVEGQSWL
jgi:cbb3-type cytochrome oxidase subunit 3